jgi:hypothetical protein
VHIDLTERSKLDAKSRKCYFIGYGVDKFGYKLWDIENHKFIRSRNVVFNEKVLYKNREGVSTGALEDITESTEDTAGNPDTPEFVELEAEDLDVDDAHPEESSERQRSPSLAERRTRRENVPMPKRYQPSLDYLLLTDNDEPESFEEALKVDAKVKWEKAMDEEMKSLSDNNTWDLVKLPEGKRALHNKWVF